MRRALLWILGGLLALAAAIPARAAIPTSDPVQRTAFFMATAAESKLKDAVSASIKRLQENKLPVTVIQLDPQPQRLNAEQRRELARWADSLDRI